ncbi:hypothetical protein Agub_g15553 [Astrephomene gubernaculifera]|uniref:Uncharacterized protein n=1 Tax=Astrephomene gubernaculifera TaxID=47775 RepID=A0AAD3E4U4_9CHLO|nr:hypothetical protein Agub_g15553 [Astrephomene gubernaculifera]
MGQEGRKQQQIEALHRVMVWAVHGPTPVTLPGQQPSKQQQQQQQGQEEQQPTQQQQPAVMHLCDCRTCINPCHVWWGTGSLNRKGDSKAYKTVVEETRSRTAQQQFLPDGTPVEFP